MTNSEYNPRGIKRPHTGIGQGVGVGGRRDGRSTEPCSSGEGEGKSTGGGRGKGKNRV